MGQAHFDTATRIDLLLMSTQRIHTNSIHSRKHLHPLLLFATGMLFTCQLHAKTIHEVIVDAVKERKIVGAQLIMGTTHEPEAKSVNLGFVSPLGREAVSSDTMFCIASCSKPLVSCVIFKLIEQQKLDLHSPTDKWLPAITTPTLIDGSNVNSPTLDQLLTHRGGIYSQKQKLNANQFKAIRDFRMTLSESVNLITKQPLISIPGTQYAYSGAGYCLIGAIAEKAVRQPFDSILQNKLCKPLGMKCTTFFPNQRVNSVVATGGVSKMPSPHLLGSEMKLPLIGGSIHTTAEDLQRFARMVAKRGMAEDHPVMKRSTWSNYVSQPYKAQRYGYGWTRTVIDNEIKLSHNGSLPPAQAALQINLTTGKYTIALWTLADPMRSKTTSQLRTQINLALNDE